MTDPTSGPIPGLTSGGFALQHAQLQAPPVHIPDGNGGAYKTELTLERSQERTSKLIWWHGDDPRPEPHNHPWPFVSTILAGGYTELRWWYGPGGAIQHAECVWRAGDRNFVDPLVFHRVTDVQPGTVTHLDCGPATPGNLWYYLHLATATTYPWTDADGNDDFLAQLHALNPHLRPG